MTGKWHVGGDARKRGFNSVRAYFPNGARGYFPLKGKRGRGGEVGKVAWTYITDWFADDVTQHVEERAGKEPLFVYWAPTAPHWPLHAKASDVEKYKDTYQVGPQAIAEARYAKMLELGLFSKDHPWKPPAILSDAEYAATFWTEYRLDIHTEAQPNYRKRNWKSGRYESTHNTKDGALSMAVYAAQIDNLDQGVGRVMNALETAGELDNTLIMFCSDNGCSSEDLGTGLHWAQVSDTPFKRYKKSAWEGGMASPMILHWPARTDPGQRGGINRSAGHLVDVMATVLDAAGVTYPSEDLKGRPLPPCEGRSLLPMLQGAHVPLSQPIGMEHGTNRALITEEWKLTADGGAAWKLFNMQTDRFEMQDVAAANPDVVAKLDGLWDEWAARTGARKDGGRVKK